MLIIFQAIQAAISQAFKTPEVIRLFGRREPKQLRERLSIIDQDLKLNKLSLAARDRQKVSVMHYQNNESLVKHFRQKS